MAKIAAAKTKVADKSCTSKDPCCSVNDEIAKLAYQFYVERGSVDGYDKEDWMRAAAIVKKGKNK